MNVSELQFSPFVNTYPSIRQAFSSIENWKKPEASRSCYSSSCVVIVVTEPSLLLNGQASVNGRYFIYDAVLCQAPDESSA